MKTTRKKKNNNSIKDVHWQILLQKLKLQMPSSTTTKLNNGIKYAHLKFHYLQHLFRI